MKVRSFHTYNSVIYFLSIVCLALLLLETWNAWNSRKVQLQETYSAVGNVSFSLEQYASATFKEADIVLADMLERIQHDGLGNGARHRLYEVMALRVKDLKGVNGIFIFDEKGDRIVSSERLPLVRLNNADREYFQEHRDHPDSVARIGRPIVSRSTGKLVITISRRINKNDGSFGGVVSATISVDYLKSFFDRFDIGNDGALSIGLMSGVLLYRRPSNPNLADGGISKQSFYQDLILKGVDSISVIKSPADGVSRYVSFRRVEDYPLFVMAALSEDERLSAWADATFVGAIFVLSALILVFHFGHKLLINIKSREIAERRLRRTKRKLAAVNRSLSQQAFQDGLTKLGNRRIFDQTLAFEANKACEVEGTLSVLMIDVDNFKLYNDQYGHPQGDVCLCSIAQEIQNCLRSKSDLAARYGGEEFGIILPGCSKDEARQIALLICDRVRKLCIPHDGNAKGVATVSIGFASIVGPYAGDARSALLAAADIALYAAKSNGRDKVVEYEKDLHLRTISP